jgi:hypothetical protein
MSVPLDIARYFIDEHSLVEYLHLFILACMAGAMARIALRKHQHRDALFAMAACAFALLVVMAGREFSFGKYHGVEHSTRTLARNTVHLAALGLAGYVVFRIWPVFGDTFRQALLLLRNNYHGLLAAIAVMAVSQIVDKDWIFAIKPPEAAVMVEEALETAAYGFLAFFLYRLFRPQSGIKTVSASRPKVAFASRAKFEHR